MLWSTTSPDCSTFGRPLTRDAAGAVDRDRLGPDPGSGSARGGIRGEHPPCRAVSRGGASRSCPIVTGWVVSPPRPRSPAGGGVSKRQLQPGRFRSSRVSTAANSRLPAVGRGKRCRSRASATSSSTGRAGHTRPAVGPGLKASGHVRRVLVTVGRGHDDDADRGAERGPPPRPRRLPWKEVGYRSMDRQAPAVKRHPELTPRRHRKLTPRRNGVCC